MAIFKYQKYDMAQDEIKGLTYLTELILQIMSAPIPRVHRPNAVTMELEPAVIAEPDASSADSLVSSNDPDDLANEQTWPTEEEMVGHATGGNGQDESIPDVNIEKKKPKRRIPKGMSDYQASWIVEDDEDDGGASGDEDEDGDMKDEGEWVTEEEEEEEEMEDAVPPAEDDVEMSESRNGVTFEDLDNEEETKQSVLTPLPLLFMLIVASIGWKTGATENAKRKTIWRSQTSSIHRKTCLHARDFNGIVACDHSEQVHGIPTKTCRAIMRAYSNSKTLSAQSGMFVDELRRRVVPLRCVYVPLTCFSIVNLDAREQPGTRVTVFLKDVPQEAAQVDPTLPFVIFALLQHEHKKTVLNFTIQRNTECEASVRSKV
jgi:pre-rRNA-processing protein TSR1